MTPTIPKLNIYKALQQLKVQYAVFGNQASDSTRPEKKTSLHHYKLAFRISLYFSLLILLSLVLMVEQTGYFMDCHGPEQHISRLILM